MKDRDLDLDFVKGFLVIVMALYHAMNYFSNVPAEYYGSLRFVNGSFVFISGYVVAAFYAEESWQQNLKAWQRLAVRGTKLLGLFTALNLAVSAIGMTSYRNVEFGLSTYFSSAASIYGSGSSDQMAFRILLPIAYAVAFSGLYLVAGRFQPLLIATTLGASLLYPIGDHAAPNLFFLLTGLSGLSVGLMMRNAHQYRVRSWALICAGFVALASVMNQLSGNVLAYCVGIALLLKLVYDGASLLAKDGRLYRTAVLLGKYSLICYIGQIGFLYLLHRALHAGNWASGRDLLLIFAGTSLFLVCTCIVLEKLRHHFRWVEQTYKFVFA